MKMEKTKIRYCRECPVYHPNTCHNEDDLGYCSEKQREVKGSDSYCGFIEKQETEENFEFEHEREVLAKCKLRRDCRSQLDTLCEECRNEAIEEDF